MTAAAMYLLESTARANSGLATSCADQLTLELPPTRGECWTCGTPTGNRPPSYNAGGVGQFCGLDCADEHARTYKQPILEAQAGEGPDDGHLRPVSRSQRS